MNVLILVESLFGLLCISILWPSKMVECRSGMMQIFHEWMCISIKEQLNALNG